MVEAKEEILSAATTSGTSLSKHKNKRRHRKVSRNGTSSDVSKYAPLVETGKWPITIRFSQNKGRHAVAAQDLEPGTIVCEEKAATLVVSTAASKDFCHNCVSSLVKAELLQQRVSCGKCRMATYCSAACRQADAARHFLECAIVPKLADIAMKNELNPDLLRLTLSLIVRKCLEERRATITDSHDGPEHAAVAPWWTIDELFLLPQTLDKNWVSNVKKAAEEMSAILPATLAMSADDITKLACRINTNAHSLTDDEERAQDTAFGLFPMGSLFFNHSCSPNAHFTADKGILTYRATKSIKAGEEVLISHIELFQPRPVRKQELLTTKQIRCDCSRCRTPLINSVDRFLDGALCTECHEGVFLAEEEFPDFVEPEDSDESASEEDTTQTDGTVTEETTEATSDRSELPVNAASEGEKPAEGEEKKEKTEEEKRQEAEEEKIRQKLMKKECRCDKCGHKIKLYQVEMLRIQAQKDYQQIFQLVQTKNHAVIIRFFKKFQEKYGKSKLLHPWHVQIVNSNLPLLTSYKELGNFGACLPIIKHLIEVYEETKIISPYRYEFVELYSELGSILQALASSNRSSEGGGRNAVAKYCMGEDDPKVLEYKKKAKI
ncbi:hypothetical protein BC832DRAFT_254396 [Gaertneriomyces semiglobifer]|nr:hypothetical protein BC832DRAFT_254396 [Gaertneriomyces semiglobifer]